MRPAARSTSTGSSSRSDKPERTPISTLDRGPALNSSQTTSAESDAFVSAQISTPSASQHRQHAPIHPQLPTHPHRRRTSQHSAASSLPHRTSQRLQEQEKENHAQTQPVSQPTRFHRPQHWLNPNLISQIFPPELALDTASRRLIIDSIFASCPQLNFSDTSHNSKSTLFLSIDNDPPDPPPTDASRIHEWLAQTPFDSTTDLIRIVGSIVLRISPQPHTQIHPSYQPNTQHAFPLLPQSYWLSRKDIHTLIPQLIRRACRETSIDVFFLTRTLIWILSIAFPSNTADHAKAGSLYVLLASELLARSDISVEMLMWSLRRAVIVHKLMVGIEFAQSMQTFLATRVNHKIRDILNRINLKNNTPSWSLAASPSVDYRHDIFICGFVAANDTETALELLIQVLCDSALQPASHSAFVLVLRTLFNQRRLVDALELVDAFVTNPPRVIFTIPSDSSNAHSILACSHLSAASSKDDSGHRPRKRTCASGRGVCIGPAVLSTIIAGLAFNGHADLAHCIIKQSKKDYRINPKADNYTSLVHGQLCSHPDNPKSAMKYVEAMVHAGFRPQLETLTTMLHHMAKSGDNTIASHIVELAFQSNLELDEKFLITLIRWQLDRGLVRDAIRVIEGPAAKSIVWSNRLLNALLIYQLRYGGHEDLNKLMHTLLEPDKDRSCIVPDRSSLTSLIQKTVFISSVYNAESWIAKMRRRGVEPNAVALTIIVRAFLRPGPDQNLDRALYWLGQLLRWDFSIDMAITDPTLRTPHLDASIFTISAAIHDLIVHHAHSSKQIVRVAHAILSRGLRVPPNTLLMLMRYLCSSGHEQDAIAIMNVSSDPERTIIKQILDRLLEKSHNK